MWASFSTVVDLKKSQRVSRFSKYFWPFLWNIWIWASFSTVADLEHFQRIGKFAIFCWPLCFCFLDMGNIKYVNRICRYLEPFRMIGNFAKFCRHFCDFFSYGNPLVCESVCRFQKVYFLLKFRIWVSFETIADLKFQIFKSFGPFSGRTSSVFVYIAEGYGFHLRRSRILNFRFLKVSVPFQVDKIDFQG